MPRLIALRTVAASVLVLACSATASAGGTSTGNTPLNDLGAGFYQGFQGALYPGGANAPPPSHMAAAMTMAVQIVPPNAAGAPDVAGWIGVISIGMSNTTHEFAVFERQEDLNAG